MTSLCDAPGTTEVAGSDAGESDNCVFLRGILAAEPEVRSLPSGDEVVSFRLTVTRSAAENRAGGRSGPKVDTIDCVTSRPRVRRTVERAAAGQQLELRGALHRRFWRSGAGVASRYEVDVESIRVVRGAGRRVTRQGDPGQRTGA
jgi:single-strand DNA-binding protein